MFTETGNKLEPQRRKVGSRPSAALRCIQWWTHVRLRPPEKAAVIYDDEKVTGGVDTEM